MSTLSILLLAVVHSASAQDTPVARAGAVSGIASVQRADGTPVILSQGSVLHLGDVVRTEKNSYARIMFSDGGELAIRAGSTVRIKDYQFHEQMPDKDSIIFQLIRGGVRSITGLIGKRGRKEAYQLETMTATIGIRGTDFIARLCEADCKEERSKAGVKRVAANPVAARVAVVKGALFTTSSNGMARSLATGSPIYIGDLLQTGSGDYAVVVFSDETKVTLQKDTQFLVSRYNYVPKQPEKGNVFLELIRGAARFATGRVAKAQPQQFNVRTVTSTIGIRGTGFDVVCAPKGDANAPRSANDDHPAQCNEAIYEHTWEGSTEIKTGKSKLSLTAGAAGYVDGPGATPRQLQTVPQFMLDNDAPRPDKVPVDMDKLFGISGDTSSDPGLYVNVKDGRIVVTQAGDSREFGAGESGYVSGKQGGGVQLLNTSPDFIEYDPYLRSMKFDAVSCAAQ